MNIIPGFARSLAAAVRAHEGLAARRRPSDGSDWRIAAQERFLGHAIDGADVERRQRIWDRDEANAYAMSGWS